MEAASLLWKIKLHESNWNDTLFLLQEHGIHFHPVRLLLLQPRIRSILLAILVNYFLQLVLYLLSSCDQGRHWGRYEPEADKRNFPPAKSGCALEANFVLLLPKDVLYQPKKSAFHQFQVLCLVYLRCIARSRMPNPNPLCDRRRIRHKWSEFVWGRILLCLNISLYQRYNCGHNQISSKR